MLRTLVLLIAMALVWSGPPKLKPGVIDILDKLVKRVGIKWIKKNMITNAMNDDDIVCMNWYLDQFVDSQRDERNQRQCPDCSLTVMCDQKPNCHSEQNCCFSYAVMDRVSKLKGTNRQCSKKSGLAFVLSIVEIKITTSDDAVHHLMNVVTNDTKLQCPVPPGSSSCNKILPRIPRIPNKGSDSKGVSAPVKFISKYDETTAKEVEEHVESCAIQLSSVICLLYLSLIFSLFSSRIKLFS